MPSAQASPWLPLLIYGLLSASPAVLAQLAACNCTAQTCTLTHGIACTGPVTGAGATTYFYVDPTTLPAKACATTEKDELVVELWDAVRIAGGPTVADPHLYAAAYQPPMVDQVTAFQSNWKRWVYQPAESLSTAPEDGTIADSVSWLLQRTYHRVNLPVSRRDWRIAVTNIAGGLNQATQDLVGYQIVAACAPAADPPCARSLDQVECAGHGVCVPTPSDTKACKCDDGWGGFSCTEAVPMYPKTLVDSGEFTLLSELPIPEARLAPREWATLMLEVPADTVTVMVELERHMGEVILFVKPEGEGFVPYDVPDKRDSKFADEVAFLEKSPHHAQTLHFSAGPATDLSAPRRIYISVYNFNTLNENPTNASLRVTTQVEGKKEALCAWGCFGNGVCRFGTRGDTPGSESQPADAQPSVCQCNAFPGGAGSWAGTYCNAELFRVDVGGDTKTGDLPSGAWVYFQIASASGQFLMERFSNGLSIDLQVDAGEDTNNALRQAVLVASSTEAVPSLTNNDFIFTSPVSEIASKDLAVTSLTVGLNNLELWLENSASQPLSYRFTVREGSGPQKQLITPIISILLAFVAIVLCCTCMVLTRRVVNRINGPSDIHMELVNLHAPAAGCPPSVIANLEVLSYDASMKASDGSTGAVEEDPAACFCLDNFEVGQQLRRLPCQHVFHQACIDTWLSNHTTCPNCRVSLLPDHPDPPLAPAESQPSLPLVVPAPGPAEAGDQLNPAWAGNRLGRPPVPA